MSTQLAERPLGESSDDAGLPSTTGLSAFFLSSAPNARQLINSCEMGVRRGRTQNVILDPDLDQVHTDRAPQHHLMMRTRQSEPV